MTFSLDGRERNVVDTFNPSRELPVTARWDGVKVRVETTERGAFATIEWTQVLSIEDGHLVVVSTSTRDRETRWGTTFKYRKK